MNVDKETIIEYIESCIENDKDEFDRLWEEFTKRKEEDSEWSSFIEQNGNFASESDYYEYREELGKNILNTIKNIKI